MNIMLYTDPGKSTIGHLKYIYGDIMEQLNEMHSNIQYKECMSGISGNLFD